MSDFLAGLPLFELSLLLLFVLFVVLPMWFASSTLRLFWAKWRARGAAERIARAESDLAELQKRER